MARVGCDDVLFVMFFVMMIIDLIVKIGIISLRFTRAYEQSER